MRTLRHLLLFAALPALLTHCSTARFYTQAAAGQFQIQSAARPISKILAEPSSTCGLKAKLGVVQEIRHFAATRLRLPSERQYHRYADIKREHLVWVVFAAPEFSLQPRTWRYPFLGELAYRGWFKEEDARRCADDIRTDGLDVFVAEVDAYSTLGWLSDPVLNTFIDRPERDLAELLFHELTHHRLYLPDDTDFNEALATAAARHATRLWLMETRRHGELASYERDNKILGEFLVELDQTRSALDVLFARDDLTTEAMRQAKAEAFKDLRCRADRLNQRHGGTLKITEWFEKPVNNARLNSIAAYHRLVPAIESLLRGPCGNDLDTLLAMLKKTRRMTPASRLCWLESQQQSAP